MNPSIGRIVHYVAPGSADGTYPPGHRAAVITELPEFWDGREDPREERVNLMVFNPTGAHWVSSCKHDEDAKGPFTWHWPERVD